MRRFRPGETAVRRDVFQRKVWSAHAFHVMRDGPGALVVGCRPGADVLAPTTWIDWLLTGDDTDASAGGAGPRTWRFGPAGPRPAGRRADRGSRLIARAAEIQVRAAAVVGRLRR